MLCAVEGIDGSGKNTQAIKLVERVSREYGDAAFFSFPDYANSTLGPRIRHYLRGALGTVYANHPLLVSLLFAVERYEARIPIVQALNVGKTVICDRYVPSNLAHQAGKLYDGGQCMDVLSLIAHIEYAILDTPTPDLVFYLDLTAEQSYARTHARDDAPDLHQDNKMYLRNVRHVYQYLAKDPSWHTITCFNEDGTPRTVDEIHAEIFEIFVAAAGV